MVKTSLRPSWFIPKITYAAGFLCFPYSADHAWTFHFYRFKSSLRSSGTPRGPRTAKMRYFSLSTSKVKRLGS